MHSTAVGVFSSKPRGSAPQHLTAGPERGSLTQPGRAKRLTGPGAPGDEPLIPSAVLKNTCPNQNLSTKQRQDANLISAPSFWHRRDSGTACWHRSVMVKRPLGAQGSGHRHIPLRSQVAELISPQNQAPDPSVAQLEDPGSWRRTAKRCCPVTGAAPRSPVQALPGWLQQGARFYSQL